MNPLVKEMSNEDLERNLITLDYRGKEFKKLCLDELVLRVKTETYSKDDIDGETAQR